MIAQREQHVLAGIAGGIFTFRREGEFTRRPEHMAMRVNRARWRREIRLLGVGMPGHLAARVLVSVVHACHPSENHPVEELACGAHHARLQHPVIIIAFQNAGCRAIRMFDRHHLARTLRD